MAVFIAFYLTALASDLLANESPIREGFAGVRPCVRCSARCRLQSASLFASTLPMLGDRPRLAEQDLTRCRFPADRTNSLTLQALPRRRRRQSQAAMSRPAAPLRNSAYSDDSTECADAVAVTISSTLTLLSRRLVRR